MVVEGLSLILWKIKRGFMEGWRNRDKKVDVSHHIRFSTSQEARRRLELEEWQL